MSASHRILIVVATYNERENLPLLVQELRAVIPEADVLVVDDNSPDGTGRWCDEQATRDPQIRCLHRPGKLGLGSATVAGFHEAMAGGYDVVFTMDADFSHDPRYLPDLYRALTAPSQVTVDVAIGSRYVPGGGVQGWPWSRQVMSRAINAYARRLLRLPVRDCSGAFRCYRVATLRKIDFEQMRAKGYAYLEEILWLLRRRGAQFVEVPIVFVDRVRGQTKINWREALTALWLIFRLALI